MSSGASRRRWIDARTKGSHRPGSAEEHRDHLGHLAEAGVDSFVLRPPGDSLDHTVEALHQYAETFLRG